jgi:threonine dehydrogenase-like Zn-dependent dehydrogenase
MSLRANTMKAFLITAPHTGGVQVVERFVPKPGEIIIRPKAVGICTSDRRLFSRNLERYPAIGGHEIAGVVDWVGDRDTALRPGDHVAVDVMNRCGQCCYCLKGSDNICVDLGKSRSSQIYIAQGGFAEYLPIPAGQALELPEDLDLEEASLIEPLACCLHSIKRGQLSNGETAVILGAGTMGTLHLLLARLSGARTIVSDSDEQRLNFARSNGADLTVNPAIHDPVAFVKDNTTGRGADVVFVTANSLAAGEHALAMVGRTGRIVLYGSLHPADTLQLDWNTVHYQEITVTGSANNTRRDFEQAAGLVGGRAISLRPLVSRVIGLDEMRDELETTPAGDTQRVIVRL